MESIQWWKSDTIRAAVGGLVASMVAFIMAVCALFGIHVDPVMQAQLSETCLALFAMVAAGFYVWGIISRRSVTTVIQGSKAEQALLDAGVPVTPHANGGTPASVAASMAATQAQTKTPSP